MKTIRVSEMTEQQAENILMNHKGKEMIIVSRNLKTSIGKLIDIDEAEFYGRTGKNKFATVKEFTSDWKEQVLFDNMDIVIVRD